MCDDLVFVYGMLLPQVIKTEFLLTIIINTISSRQVMRIEKNVNHGIIS